MFLMGRILTSPTRAVRAVRVARGEGCFEWGANPPAHPGLSGLPGARGVLNGERTPHPTQGCQGCQGC